MQYSEFFKLTENKDRFIDANLNLNNQQKEEIKNYFRTHTSQERLIDWNVSKFLTYDDFAKVMNNVSANAQKKHRLFSVQEGVDYIKLGTDTYHGRPVELYQPRNWKGSAALASNQFGPEIWSATPSWNGDDVANSWGKAREDGNKPGAKWCISMHTTKRHWNDYNEDYVFIFFFDPENPVSKDRKLALVIDEGKQELVQMFNAWDDSEYFNLELQELADKYIPLMKPTELSLPDNIKLNEATGRYDIDNSDDDVDMRKYIKDGEFIFPIGEYKGVLYLAEHCVIIKNLKNFPTKIIGGISLEGQPITSLIGMPEYVKGAVDLPLTDITSLEGLPKYIGGLLNISRTAIKNFKGAEETVVGSVKADECNELESCIGFPKEVEDDICLRWNRKLTSLKGLPRVVHNLDIQGCSNLKTLEGGPERVRGIFRADKCGLVTLVGGPKVVYEKYWCRDNKITSLKGIARGIDELLQMDGNPLDPDDPYTPEEFDGVYGGPRTKGTDGLDVYSKFNIADPRPRVMKD